MLNLRKAMKGISFLLCLGFFAYQAHAATTIDDIKNNQYYGTCAAAQKHASEYNTINESCKPIQKDIDEKKNSIEKVCAEFKSKKSEYKKCTNGQQTSIDEAKIRAGKKEDISAINSRTARISELLGKISAKNQELSSCVSKRDTALSNAKSALKTCETDAKASKNADTKVTKANDKAKDANKKDKKAQQALQDAEKSYNDAVYMCNHGSESACSQVDKLFKAYDKAAKAANKTAKKAETANQKAWDAQDNQALAHEKSGMNACASHQVWDGSKCVVSDSSLQSLTQQKDACLANIDASADRCKSIIEKWSAAGIEKHGIDFVESPETYSVTSSFNGDTVNVELEDIVIEAKARNTHADCEAIKTENGGLAGEGKGTYNVFRYLACRITAFVADVRDIVYVLAGFGLIFCAYSAIIGKMSFKHLASITFGVFMLSMITSFINYVVYGDDYSEENRLEFGEWLPNGNHAQFNQIEQNCATNPALCPSGKLAAQKDNASGWNFANDIGGSISSVTDGIAAITSAYTSVNSNLAKGKSAWDNIGDAISGMSSGNILNSLSTIASNVAGLSSSLTNTVNSLAQNGSRFSNDFQNVTLSQEQRQYLQQLDTTYKNLKSICGRNPNAPECAEFPAVEAEWKQAQTWVDTFLAGTGDTILSVFGIVDSKVRNTSAGVASVESAQRQGQSTGNYLGGSGLGDFLGASMAAGEAVTQATNAYNNNSGVVNKIGSGLKNLFKKNK